MIKSLVILALCLIFAKTQNAFTTVAIIGTNDIHGSAFPKQLYRSDTQEFYNYGGLEYMATLIDTIKQEYKGNVLWLDAGDQFQGGIEASPLVSSGQIMNDFYNTLQVDASAIGNHEFDFGPNILFPYWYGRADPSLNLAANVFSEKGEQQFLPKHKNTFLYELQSGIKIGVIGLSTIETPSTTGAFAEGMFPDYQFEQYTQIVRAKSRELRERGANAVLIVSHVGNDCDANQVSGFWEASTVQKSKCDPTDEITTLLSMLPVGTVDGIVQGHRHRFSHHFIKGVPVMGTINGGYYFNVMYLKFYNNQIYDRIIEGPIPVCEKVFEHYRRCNYLGKDDLEVAGSLVEWTFHGKPVVAHPQLHELFTTKWLPKMKEFLVPLVNNEIVLAKVTDQESELGNLITNLIHSACSPHDVVIVNPGGFRTIWTPGVIQFQHFYNMFPFNNLLVSFEMTGYELLQTLRIIQGGRKGFYPAWGLRQRVSLAEDGTRTFLGATFSDGSQIELSRNYRVVSIDFLTNGGDDFKDVMGKVYTLRKQVKEGEMRDLLKPELIKLGTIREGSLIDPENPRLQVVQI